MDSDRLENARRDSGLPKEELDRLRALPLHLLTPQQAAIIFYDPVDDIELNGLCIQQKWFAFFRAKERAMQANAKPLSPTEEALVEARLAAHHADPASSLPMDEVIARLSARFTR